MFSEEYQSSYKVGYKRNGLHFRAVVVKVGEQRNIDGGISIKRALFGP